MLDCKQSNIDSGATPIRSAVAHPTKKARQLESMLDCKQSNIDSGATPIGSAVAHPIKRRNYGLKQLESMHDCKQSNIDSGATPIGRAVAHPIKRRNYGLRPIQAKSRITYVLLEGRWQIPARRRPANFPCCRGWYGARCLRSGVGLRVFHPLLHDGSRV